MMAKFWTPGEVKTRLGAAVGMSAAARLHRLFTGHLCQTLRHCGDSRWLCVAPDRQTARFSEFLKVEKLDDSWQVVPQGEGDLGQRMSHWFGRYLTAGPGDDSPQTPLSAVLIGADCPTLNDQTIRQAAQLLDHHDVVLGPAVDGGYYLIGLRGPWSSRLEPIFDDVPWSEPEVFRITCDRIAQSGLSLGLLPVAEDIDTVAELDRLGKRLGEESADRSRNLLRQMEKILETGESTR